MSLFAAASGIRLPKPTSSPIHDIVDLPPPDVVVLPMRQTVGYPATPVVAVGDQVKKGQMIGEPADPVGVPIIATISGTVMAIEERPGPEARAELSVVIQSDGEDAWETDPELDSGAMNLSPRDMLERIRTAGVINSGLGAEPSHRDLGTAIDPRGYVGVSGTPITRSVENLIIRAVDVDPSVDTLEATLAGNLDAALNGFEVLKHILGATAIHLILGSGEGRGIQQADVERLCDPLEIWPVEVKPWNYPSVNDELLIRTVTGMEVGGTHHEPRDMGVIVENIDTVIAVGCAVLEQRAQIDRVVHVSGCVKHPKLLRVRIGTPISDVLSACGGIVGEPGSVIFGGVMRGRAQHDLGAPITRNAGGLVVLSPDEQIDFTNEPCMNCGACVATCPMRLLPSTLSKLCEYGKFDVALSYDLLTCIECGCCTYVCPSMRANGHYLLHGKAEVMSRRQRT